MTKDKAIYAWFTSYAQTHDMAVYTDTSVPDEAVLPYLTYNYTSANMGDTQVPITVNIWKRTTSEAEMNELAEAFRTYIKANDTIACDEGTVLVFTGSPFCLSQVDSTDKNIKLRYINITFDYCTK